MPKRKKYVQKVKIVRISEEGHSTEIKTLNPECSPSKKVLPTEHIETMEIIDAASTQEVPSTNVRSYSNRKIRERELWEALEEPMLHARIEEITPLSSTCFLCDELTEEIIYCPDCGPHAYYCKKCCDKIHAVVLYHKPCCWKKCMFVPYMGTITLLTRRDHAECSSRYIKSLTVFSISGHQHQTKIQFCNCEKEAVTLLRHNMWPSSPEHPESAFDLRLLDLAVSLQLESQISLQSFCNALMVSKSIFPVQVNPNEVKDLYRNLIGDSFYEYRTHRKKMNEPKTFEGSLAETENSNCPICNKEEVEKIISMDGNFGLVHKKNAGEGVGQRRNLSKFFCDQESVDSFVESYGSDRRKIQSNCSEFQAGNIVRSKRKNEKLDITGVFGSVCQHDIPQKFLNLRHGERFAYPVYLLRRMREIGAESNTIMYDIGCLLHKHIKKENEDLSNFKFVVPIFHMYAHNMQCQVEFGQKFVNDVGLNDGEGVERLWSYLRRFSAITKEMTISNRQDLLEDALDHYSNRIKEKLGEKLKTMFKRSQDIQEEAIKHFRPVEEKYQGNVAEWLKDWQVISKQQGKDASALTTTEKYCWLQFQIDKNRQQLSSSVDDEEKSILEKQIAKDEQAFRKMKRVNIDEEVKKQTLSTANAKVRVGMINKLQHLANEREYIVSLLRKYCDGQEMAQRISKQLSSVNDKIKKAVEAFNTTCFEKYSFSDVCHANASIFKDTTTVTLSKDQLDACQSYLRYLKAVKQEDMTRNEINALLSYIQEQNAKLLSKISEMDSIGRFNVGKKHILLMFKLRQESLWMHYFSFLSDFSRAAVKFQIHEFVSLGDNIESIINKEEEFVDIDSDDSDIEI